MTPFNQLAPLWLQRLQVDLAIQQVHAAGILGNLGFESAGFTKLQEIKPLVASSRGGAGCAMWTGPRRIAFEKYAVDHKLALDGDAANYAFLCEELRTTHAYCLRSLRPETTLERSVFVFGRDYEAPAGTTSTYLPALADRLVWAKRALGQASAPTTTSNATVTDVQHRLITLGKQIGIVDGVAGPRTCQAILDCLAQVHA